MLSSAIRIVDVSQIQTENDVLRVNCQALNKQVFSLQALVREQNAELQQLRIQQQNVSIKCASLEDVIAKQRLENANLRSNTQVLSMQIEGLVLDKRSADISLSALRKQQENLRRALDVTNVNRVTLESQQAELCNQVGALQSENEALRTTALEELLHRNKKLEVDLLLLQEKYEQQQVIAETFQKESEELMRHGVTISFRNDAEKAMLRKQIEELQALYDRLQRESSEEIAELRRRVATLESDNAVLTKQVTPLLNEVDELKMRLDVIGNRRTPPDAIIRSLDRAADLYRDKISEDYAQWREYMTNLIQVRQGGAWTVEMGDKLTNVVKLFERRKPAERKDLMALAEDLWKTHYTKAAMFDHLKQFEPASVGGPGPRRG